MSERALIKSEHPTNSPSQHQPAAPMHPVAMPQPHVAMQPQQQPPMTAHPSHMNPPMVHYPSNSAAYPPQIPLPNIISPQKHPHFNPSAGGPPAKIPNIINNIKEDPAKIQPKAEPQTSGMLEVLRFS